MDFDEKYIDYMINWNDIDNNLIKDFKKYISDLTDINFTHLLPLYHSDMVYVLVVSNDQVVDQKKCLLIKDGKLFVVKKNYVNLLACPV